MLKKMADSPAPVPSKTRPKRKGYRGSRNRAIVYVLIETGRHIIKVEEKGGLDHAYQISREGIEAVQAYLEHERAGDFDKWSSPELFLAAASNPHGDGRLNEWGINAAWKVETHATKIHVVYLFLV